MRKIYFMTVLLFSSLVFAQVGINTDTPEATLHVSKDSNNSTPGYTNGGMILEYPGVEKTTLASSNPLLGFNELQSQNILVQNDTDGKVNHMKRWAFTYLPARPSILPFIGYREIDEMDYTILVRGDITLPTGDKFVGKVINLVYDSQTELSYTINGPMKYKGYLINSLPINDINVGYTLQSDGSKWFVVGGYEVNEADEEINLTYMPIRKAELGDVITVGPDDYSFLTRGTHGTTLTLPVGEEFVGKVINVVFDTQHPGIQKIVPASGVIKHHAYVTSELVLSRNTPSYTLQYLDRWYVINETNLENPDAVEFVKLFANESTARTDRKVFVAGNINLISPTKDHMYGQEIVFVYDGDGTQLFTLTVNGGGSIVGTGSTNNTFVLGSGYKSVKLKSNGTDYEVVATR